MAPELSSLESWREYVKETLGFVLNLQYKDVSKVLNVPKTTLYCAVTKGDLRPQGESKEARFDYVCLWNYARKKGWIVE